MGARGQELARRLDEANAELARAIEQCSDAAWQSTCDSEGWTVGVTAHHVAAGHEQVAALVQIIANGQQMPAFTVDTLNQSNAEHARAAAGCTREETLKLLRENGPAASRVIAGLSDEQLDRTAPFFGGSMSAEQLIEGAMIGHAIGHLASMKAAAPA
jgi:uncharacterized damage-inducible protein DinB